MNIIEKSDKAHAEDSARIAALEDALRQIATMKPSPIVPGIVHGPALLLSNCQRIARRALRKKSN